MSQTSSRYAIFLVVATGVFMSTLDSSMVNIALPVLMRTFGCTLHCTQWVVMIYLLTISVSLVLWGHLGDRLGRRRIYSAGMLIFGLGSLACAMAPGIYWLILSRFGQAVGAAMMMASGPAIIREHFPEARLGRNLGLIGMAVSLGLMTGPSVGGFLIQYLSWRAIFLVTVPVGLAFCLLAWLVLPDAGRTQGARDFDWAGSIAWAVSATIGLLTITNSPVAWGSPLFFIFLGLGTIIFGLFLRQEASAAHPLFPLQLFRQRFFYTGMICALLSFANLSTVTLLTPFFLDHVLGLAPSRIGLIMMCIPLSVLVVAPISGWLSDHVGHRYLTTAGLLTSTASLLLLSGLSSQAQTFQIAWRLTLLGCGQAMFLSPNSASVLANVGIHQAGVASGLLATARNFGMLFGVAQAGLLFSLFFARYTGGMDLKDFSTGQVGSFMAALQVTFLTAAAIGVAAALLSWGRGTGLRRTRRGGEGLNRRNSLPPK